MWVYWVPNEAHLFPQTQLSLSKLALLASGSETEAGDVGSLNRELSIIEYQRKIPDSVLEVVPKSLLPLSNHLLLFST